MKKHFSIMVIAMMALVVAFGSCKKDPKPEPTPDPTVPTYVKTLVTSDLYFSPDFFDFFDINYTVNNFQGEEIAVSPADTIARVFETTEENGTMKTIFTIAQKAELPEIDPEREYRFTFRAHGMINTLNSFNEMPAIQLVNLSGFPMAGITYHYQAGALTNPDALERFLDQFKDTSKTVTFTVTDGNKVTAE